MKAVKISVASTIGVPRINFDFALTMYSCKFLEYADVEASKTVLELFAFPYRITPFGKQYLADAILEAGLRMRREDHQIVIIITSADIYTGGTNYVFGLATLWSAVVSSARIDPSFWRGFREIFRHSRKGRPFFEEQYSKVLIHELGHALGLPHCPRWSCAMHYSNSPPELYRKGGGYCDVCWRRASQRIKNMTAG